MRELFTSVRCSLLCSALLYLTQFCIRLLVSHPSYLTVTNKRIKREMEGFAEMKPFVGKTGEKENKRSGFTQQQKDGESDGNDKSRG